MTEEIKEIEKKLNELQEKVVGIKNEYEEKRAGMGDLYDDAMIERDKLLKIVRDNKKKVKLFDEIVSVVDKKPNEGHKCPYCGALAIDAITLLAYNNVEQYADKTFDVKCMICCKMIQCHLVRTAIVTSISESEVNSDESSF